MFLSLSVLVCVLSLFVNDFFFTCATSFMFILYLWKATKHLLKSPIIPYLNFLIVMWYIYIFLRHKFKTYKNAGGLKAHSLSDSVASYFFLASICRIFAKTVHLAPQNGFTSVTAALANEPHYSLIFGKASYLCEHHRDGKATILSCERVQLPN